MRFGLLFLCLVLLLPSYGCRRDLIDAKERILHLTARENKKLKAIRKIVVFPFAVVGQNNENKDISYYMAKELASQLIDRRNLSVVHPDVLKAFLGGENPISLDEQQAVAKRFGVDGFIRPVITNISVSADRIIVEVDINLYTVSQEPRQLIHFHKIYDSASKKLLPYIKSYAVMFNLSQRPYGWKVILIKRDLFYSFICWDIVYSAF